MTSKMEGGSNNIQEESSADLEKRSTGCDIGCCDPRRNLHRFIALFFMCFLGFGSYFCYDNPAAMQDNFTKELNFTNTEFTVLYSIYSWPNVIMCFIGGFLIDRVFGTRLGTSIYMGLTLIGQLLFASGGMFNAYWLMLVGRFTFGIGAESLAVAQNNYAVMWFKGKELNMVFGLQLSFARVGSTVNFLVIDPVYKWVNESYSGKECIGIVLYLATLTCILSMVCALILGILDKRAERILQRPDTTESGEVHLTDIFKFPFQFWLVTIICVAFYVSIFPFIAVGKKFFIERFGMRPEEANQVNSIVYLISAFASPVCGFLIDKTGRNVFWIFMSTCFTIAAHTMLAFTYINPYVGMALMGLSYSVLASALWPLVSLLIPEYQLGTAYGICQSIQNLGLAVISIVTGLIVDHGGYYWLEVFFISSLFISLACTSVMLMHDLCKNGMLNMSPSQREHRQTDISRAEILERDQLINTVANGISAQDLLHQSSDFHIRNRYLCRIGAPLPAHYNVNSKALTYRALR